MPRGSNYLYKNRGGRPPLRCETIIGYNYYTLYLYISDCVRFSVGMHFQYPITICFYFAAGYITTDTFIKHPLRPLPCTQIYHRISLSIARNDAFSIFIFLRNARLGLLKKIELVFVFIVPRHSINFLFFCNFSFPAKRQSYYSFTGFFFFFLFYLLLFCLGESLFEAVKLSHKNNFSATR